MGNNRTKSLQTVEIDGGNYTLIAERIKHLANEFDSIAVPHLLVQQIIFEEAICR